MRIRAMLLDVEGTTTPISFVYDVLFPYARRHLQAYVAARLATPELEQAAAMLAAEWASDIAAGEPVPARRPTADDEQSLSGYLNWLMDRDRKSPGLKLIQGLIWVQGYRSGELHGQVFEDVPRALLEWAATGLTVAIYSSGSELAQRSLFAHSEAGDLTASIAKYFDTSIGPKRSPESYARIAADLHLAPADVMFISDVDAELEAAHDAGCQAIMCVRPGNATVTSRVAPTIRSFNEVRSLLVPSGTLA